MRGASEGQGFALDPLGPYGPRPLDFAPAKINLFLHITGRRPDGYHELDSLAVFAGIADTLTVTPSPTLTLALQGPFATSLTANDPTNLVLKAARALATPQGAALTLTKNLPIASGIGGGSSDAAATLRLLNNFWQLNLPPQSLHRLAMELGADVPVCLEPRPTRMRGIGEILSPAPTLPPCGLALINPGVAVSTPAVFAARTGGFSPPASLPTSWPNAAAMAADLAQAHNDLEPPAIALCPPTAEILTALRQSPHCLLARMSGSGATCFALYATAQQAADAAEKAAQPGWWRWGGALWDFTPPPFAPNDEPPWGVAKR